VYCFCAKFGQLILRKINKIVATTRQIFRFQITRIQFRLGLRPRPDWGSLQRSPDPLAGFKGLTSKAESGRGKEGKVENGMGG